MKHHSRNYHTIKRSLTLPTTRARRLEQRQRQAEGERRVP